MRKQIRILSFILMLAILFVPFLSLFTKSVKIAGLNIGINDKDTIHLFYNLENFFNLASNNISPILLLVTRIFIIVAIILVISYGVLMFVDENNTKINLRSVSTGIFVLLLLSLIMILVVSMQNYNLNIAGVNNKANLNLGIGFYILCIPLAGSIVGMISSNKENDL